MVKERRPRGRPKKPADDLLAERVELRITSGEKAAFEQAASADGVSLSEWIRRRLNKVAKPSKG